MSKKLNYRDLEKYEEDNSSFSKIKRKPKIQQKPRKQKQHV